MLQRLSALGEAETNNKLFRNKLPPFQPQMKSKNSMEKKPSKLFPAISLYEGQPSKQKNENAKE